MRVTIIEITNERHTKIQYVLCVIAVNQINLSSHNFDYTQYVCIYYFIFGSKFYYIDIKIAYFKIRTYKYEWDSKHLYIC